MKVGKYDIPKNRLNAALIESAKKIYDTYKADEASSKNVAALLKYSSERNGAYLQKIADLRAYGLIGKPGIKITELGKKITWGQGEEKTQAKKESVLKIPLWKIFYDTWGTNLPTTDFWSHLGKIAELEAPAAKDLEKSVMDAYVEDFKTIPPEVPQGPGGQTPPHVDGQGGQNPPPPDGGTTNEKRELVVNINIQVNLPEKGDADQYDKIFAAIKKHLFTE